MQGLSKTCFGYNLLLVPIPIYEVNSGRYSAKHVQETEPKANVDWKQATAQHWTQFARQIDVGVPQRWPFKEKFQ